LLQTPKPRSKTKYIIFDLVDKMKNAAIALTILGFASLTEGYQVRSMLQNNLT